MSEVRNSLVTRNMGKLKSPMFYASYKISANMWGKAVFKIYFWTEFYRKLFGKARWLYL